jgi:prepilin-type N-terminal cleavage/methylation domain-containing protein
MTPPNRLQDANTDAPASDDGFTLVELIIVIVILGILSGIAVFAVQGMTGNSVQAACQSDYKTTEVAVETFRSQLGHYPTAGSDGVTGTNAVPALLATDTLVTPNMGPWLRDNPTNGNHYQIEVATNGLYGIQVYQTDGVTPIGNSGTIADCDQTH